jgi:hypothetical protein
MVKGDECCLTFALLLSASNFSSIIPFDSPNSLLARTGSTYFLRGSPELVQVDVRLPLTTWFFPFRCRSPLRQICVSRLGERPLFVTGNSVVYRPAHSIVFEPIVIDATNPRTALGANMIFTADIIRVSQNITVYRPMRRICRFYPRLSPPYAILLTEPPKTHCLD